MNDTHKKQVIVIHGGDAYDTYEEYLAFLKGWNLDFEKYRSSVSDWKQNLANDLGEGYEVILPAMPNKMNAKYSEWKIWFEKFIPFFDQKVILAGHSLGGTFLAKYLSENNLPKTIIAAFLVAPAFDSRDTDYSMGDFVLANDLSNFERQAKSIFIYHSQDDPVVPFADLDKFKQKLPSAATKTFQDRKHFKQEHFPELAEDIKILGQKII